MEKIKDEGAGEKKRNKMGKKSLTVTEKSLGAVDKWTCFALIPASKTRRQQEALVSTFLLHVE